MPGQAHLRNSHDDCGFELVAGCVEDVLLEVVVDADVDVDDDVDVAVDVSVVEDVDVECSSQEVVTQKRSNMLKGKP